MGKQWVLPTLPATRNGVTFTAAGDGMVHAKGTATDWATILVTQDLPAGDYQMLVSVSPGKTVDATITPILRKLN